MSTPDTPTSSPTSSLSRRRVLTGAAWTAPVIVVAAAVPAHAASGVPGALAIEPGESAAVPADVEGVPYVDLVLTGLSITVPGPVEAGQLRLTATFVPDDPSGPADLAVYGEPDGWVVTPATGDAATVTLALVAAVEAGSEVQVPDGDYLGTAAPATEQTGSFALTATAPGLTSASVAFATGPPPVRGLRRAGGYRRPV